MKLFRTVALGLATAAALLSGNAFAQTTPQFQVSLTLTPKCYVNKTATPDHGVVNDVTLNYDAFQASPARGSTSFTVSCTKGLDYSIAVASASETTAGMETIAGINYYLKLVPGSSVQYASAGGESSVTGQTGDGSPLPYIIGVSAPGGQAGDCSVSCTGNKIHTITVSY